MNHSVPLPLRRPGVVARLTGRVDRWFIAALLLAPPLAWLASALPDLPCNRLADCSPHELGRLLIAAPVLEECALRAGLQCGLRDLWPDAARRWRIDVWLSALAFTLLHAAQMPSVWLAALLLPGLAIGAIFARARDHADRCNGSAFAGLPSAIGLHLWFSALALLVCGAAAPLPFAPP